ncbi:MAG: bifunctional diaminohydroxyphosphoribosylaminopyrimidine deaminase/5-amino-6-(5-phosphoribosylamino)uracil reductase RibD [Planctomycetota bacterium]|jgi:diaminohydroxyphosphoribosylaminopyrimidine deaminase/5-amino-6-(5-phosphoribosylamino)uracil reductase
MQDTKYMMEALKLAQRGVGAVEPNPAVGCVIVKGGRIIGRGWHKKFGGHHAEINALADCKERGSSPRGASMYVNLEPCCHYGKTGPCTDAIITAGVAKVVIAMPDPSKRAKGIKQLRKAGIEVSSSVCSAEAKLLNASFIKFHRTGRCWTVLKWAQSIDGKMAWADKAGDRRWISNELSRKDVHKLRCRVGAILVGIGTVLADDPLLTARPGRAKQPTRIILDSQLRIPLNCKLLATIKEAPVLIVTARKAIKAKPKKEDKIIEKGAEVLVVPTAKGRLQLVAMLDELSNRGIAQLLVEGGPTVISSFLRQRLADEFIIYISPKILGRNADTKALPQMVELSQAVGLSCVEIKSFGDDVRIRGFSKRALKEVSIKEG